MGISLGTEHFMKVVGGYQMAYYMLQTAYTPMSLSSQMKNPQNVFSRTNIEAAIGSLGGKLLCTYYSFGEYDLVQIMEIPDNISAASVSIVAASGGALKASKITALLSEEEGLDAFKKASTVNYKPGV
jgi:uncharacterized protein with GYD domain